jgi:hypothetical protein
VSDGESAPAAPSGDASATARDKYHCPSCGAEANWNPARQALVCSFCGTESKATLRVRGAADAGSHRAPSPGRRSPTQILAPVWLLAYIYRGRAYQVVVNGVTGKTSGARRWSWVKIALTAIAILLVLVVLGRG